MTKHKGFRHKLSEFNEGGFSTAKRPRSPSPRKKNYATLAQTKSDSKTKCIYIHPDTGKRCTNLLGLYPEYCELHTMMINNVYIGKSNIKKAGNGLFAGPYGFRKGDIIGKYSYTWNKVSLGSLKERCTRESCWDYVFCNHGESNNTACWDGLDIRSTLMRNINDAHNSGFRNNSYFDIIDNKAYVVASRTIKPHTEIFVTYGKTYW